MLIFPLPFFLLQIVNYLILKSCFQTKFISTNYLNLMIIIWLYFQVPATREVLGSLPNVFSALCLNARGLASFTRYSPFERLFRVLHSPIYLSAMRRRRSSDPIGDTATNLGSAMDELMRHQPVLKTPAITAIVEVKIWK